MDQQLSARVRFRARFRCEYCRAPETASELPFPVDHIIARQHGGQTEIDNLALSCPSCNRHKGPHLATVEWPAQDLIPLYHPRRDKWNESFRRDGPRLAGITPVGQATARLLQMNSDINLAIRQTLMNEGLD